MPSPSRSHRSRPNECFRTSLLESLEPPLVPADHANFFALRQQFFGNYASGMSCGANYDVHAMPPRGMCPLIFTSAGAAGSRPSASHRFTTMPAVANAPVENDDPIRIVVPSEHRERRTTWSHGSALKVGGRGFSRDIEAFKSEN